MNQVSDISIISHLCLNPVLVYVIHCRGKLWLWKILYFLNRAIVVAVHLNRKSYHLNTKGKHSYFVHSLIKEVMVIGEHMWNAIEKIVVNHWIEWKYWFIKCMTGPAWDSRFYDVIVLSSCHKYFTSVCKIAANDTRHVIYIYIFIYTYIIDDFLFTNCTCFTYRQIMLYDCWCKSGTRIGFLE